MLALIILLATAGVIVFGLLALFLLASFRAYVAGTIFALLCVVCLLADIKFLQFRKMTSGGDMGMPPTTVTSAEVKEENWAARLSAVGSISAVQGAVLSTDLAGTVAEVNFQNGAIAKQGDVLVKLVASQEEADLELARNDLMRARDLAARKVISKAELDAAESKFKQKESMVAKKEVRAPFDGQLGIRQVNVGQMIKEGQQVVALTALDPVYVDFALPEKRMPQLAPGLEVHVRTEAFPDREFVGKLTAINSAVDAGTRNVILQATLDNHEKLLRPGMFAKVDVMLPSKEPVLAVPATAIAYAPYGDSVFVIEKRKIRRAAKKRR